MSKYRIYIDETGNADLGSSDNPNHRFLSLTGVIFDLEYVDRYFHIEFDNFKKRHFPFHVDEPVIFHRKDMINKKGPFEKLRNASQEEMFNKDFIQYIQKWNYTVISVLMDKKEHRERYEQWVHHPYHYCLEVLLERFIFFLREHDSVGDVMIESRGGKEDRALKTAYFELFNSGNYFLSADYFHKYLTSRKIKVKPKYLNITGLQMADLLAHPSRKDMLEKGGFENNRLSVFGKEIIKVLQQKYYKKSEKINGYGIKILP